MSDKKNDIGMCQYITLRQPLSNQYIRWNFVRFVFKFPNHTLFQRAKYLYKCIHFLFGQFGTLQMWAQRKENDAVWCRVQKHLQMCW